jgi:hypothetical protein
MIAAEAASRGVGEDGRSASEPLLIASVATALRVEPST